MVPIEVERKSRKDKSIAIRKIMVFGKMNTSNFITNCMKKYSNHSTNTPQVVINHNSSYILLLREKTIQDAY
jgi:hypothetical protein